MSHWERQASGGMIATPAAPATGVGSLTTGSSPRSGLSSAGGNGAFLWEEWFRTASSAQQQELLTLASCQGFLYSHQVPIPATGAKKNPPGEGVQHRILSQVFGGQLQNLPTFQADPKTPVDLDLDAAQKDAVARALETPDVFLIQGLPGTGKSRVVAEILTQAGLAGKRVLFLAATAAAIDCVLEQIATRRALWPVRCLEPGEKIDHLAPAVAALTLSRRLQFLREQTLQGARRSREGTEERCRRRHQEEPLWSRLEDLAQPGQNLQHQLDLLQEQLAQVSGNIQGDVAAAVLPRGDSPENSFVGLLREQARIHQESRARRAANLAQGEKNLEAVRAEISSLNQEIDALKPMVQAKQQGRWWTLTWWRATFQGQVLVRMTELEALQQTTFARQAQADQEVQRLTQALKDGDQEYQAQMARGFEAELARRQTVLADRAQECRGQITALRTQWDQLTASLELEEARPAAWTMDAVNQARQRWQQQLVQDEENCRFAGQWADFLEESAEQLAARLPGYANLVAGTFQGVSQDKQFGETSGLDFDLLVMEEAGHVTETDFLKAARRAHRWVLVGEPSWDHAEGVARNAEREASARSGLRAPRSGLRSDWFHRLWHHLHPDPSRLPYAWVCEGNRLCCRLRPVAPEQRQRLESERLADYPDIELRILSLPRTNPMLVEVVFPPSLPIHQAKEYIYKELQELPIQVPGRTWSRLEDDEKLVIHFGEVPAAATPVALEPGVREIVAPAEQGAWHTCRLEFDKAAGWTRNRVDTWLTSYLALHDLGRTACLPTPFRMQPGLAGIIGDLLFDRGYVLPCSPLGSAQAVQFVPVPSLNKPDDQRKHSTPVAARNVRDVRSNGLPRAGAGLELDLTAPRHVDRLPTELRTDLPRRGFVNYLEAMAVIRQLEQLARDPARASFPWNGQPAIAVLALYSGQVELIRRLIQRSPLLSQVNFPIVVELPQAFRHRECPVVLVSLTRSHHHRPVSLGEDEAALGIALTRARDQLILFGDPGTLVHRSTWKGPLDHLDDIAAAREGQIVCGLLRYLQGQGKFAAAFHLAVEGGRA